jgi:hypothetical protein
MRETLMPSDNGASHRQGSNNKVGHCLTTSTSGDSGLLHTDCVPERIRRIVLEATKSVSGMIYQVHGDAVNRDSVHAMKNDPPTVPR